MNHPHRRKRKIKSPKVEEKMSTLQAAPNPAQEIISNINAVNAKIDSLAETIGDIAIDDGLKLHIDKRLAEIAPKDSA